MDSNESGASLKTGLSSKEKCDQKKPREAGQGERPPQQTKTGVTLNDGSKGTICQ